MDSDHRVVLGVFASEVVFAAIPGKCAARSTTLSRYGTVVAISRMPRLPATYVPEGAPPRCNVSSFVRGSTRTWWWLAAWSMRAHSLRSASEMAIPCRRPAFTRGRSIPDRTGPPLEAGLSVYLLPK